MRRSNRDSLIHRDRHGSLSARIGGTDRITRFFAACFELASQRLSAGDMAVLASTPSGRLVDLDWLPLSDLTQLRQLLQALADRPLRHRYRLRRPERDRMISLAGGATALSDPRRMFVLAGLIDEANPQLRDDWTAVSPEQWARDRVGLPAPAFFAEINNAPPPLGQMTAVQICQRWMRNLAVIGNLKGIEGLGPFPVPEIKRVLGRDLERLREAVEDGALRFGLVAWRQHQLESLDWSESPPGCFRVDGLKTPPPEGCLDAVLERMSQLSTHVAMFPELSFPDADLNVLRSWLQRERPRYPVLIAVGRTHRDENGVMTNSALLLNSRGEVLLEHRKREPYTMTVAGSSRGLLEGIGVPANAFEVLDSPIGRVGLNVCRDIRSDVPVLLNRILGISLLLLPAYSHRLDFALEEARVLGQRQLAIVCGVNPFNRTDLRDGAMVYAPIRGRASGQTVPWPPVPQEGGDLDAPLLVWECRIVAGQLGEQTAPVWDNH